MDSNGSAKPTVGEASSTASEHHDFIVVGIGASAGGITALKQFFAQMPDDSGMTFVVILHLSQQHESNLAAILQTNTAMPVIQVQQTLKVEPNHVYVIPPAKHLKMVDGTIQLAEPEPTFGRRVPIDLLFRTLGDAYQQKGVCIVLSGTGSDGTLGLKRVKEEGGIAIVQDPVEAEYDGMPRSAIETNLADLILPIAEMPAKLVALKESVEKIKVPDGDHEKLSPVELGEEALHEVLTLLRARTGHDFSNYKRPSLLRRVARRLHVHELADIPSYVSFLRENPDEVHSLLRDLLISVTNFFRDREAFEALEREVVPKLFHGKGAGDQVRVWVAACATGEEAYSIAILLSEFAETLSDPPKIQIFASDIDEEAIATARECRYEETIAGDISPERLKKFFVKEDNLYRVKKALRETVLFAHHNVLRDPPFSKLDLISCRNLLIYLNRTTQEGVFEIFHFALDREGFLLLGSSESTESATKLYSAVDKKHRIYKCRPGVSTRQQAPAMPITGKWQVKFPDVPMANHKEIFSFGELHYQLLERYAPPSVLVNEDYEIVHLSENAGRYLRLVGGEPSRNLLKIVHPPLRLDLRATLIEAKQEEREAESRHIPVELEGKDVFVNLIVRPFDIPESASSFLLILFDEVEKSDTLAKDLPPVNEVGEKDAAIETVVTRLENELLRTRDRLRATIEQHETSIEEHKASNEELQAINEELRSASEELETSKEELQSVNEELSTVNHELKDKIEEVIRTNSDLQNFLASTDIGTIFLDRDLQIKRYTPRVRELFNIIASDIGRPFAHLTHRLDYDDLENDAAQVLLTLRTVEREVHSTDCNYYIARFLPYRTLEDKIDGVVLTFIDITEIKRATDTVREREATIKMAQRAAKAGVWNLRVETGEAWWSKECYELYGLEADDQKMSFESWLSKFHANEATRVEAAIRQAIEKNEDFSFEVRVHHPTKGERWLWEIGRAEASNGKALQMAGITLDITERKEMEESLTVADHRKDEFLAILAHELRNPLAPILSGFDIMQHSDDTEIGKQAQSTIERQLAHIVRLVDDLLDVSRITQGKIKLQMERAELADIISFALETNQPLLEAAQHELQVTLPSEPIYLEGDKMRLTQVIFNLLNNAVKYTEPGGVILLNAVKEADQAVIRIKDSGIGIPKEMLSSIFVMFTQVERSPNHKPSGLGIGLSLVKNLVEMHGGTIEAFSDHTGSEFVIHLPLSANQRPLQKGLRTDEQKKSADSATKKRVLVVDDNVDAAKMMEILLSGEGHEVLMAYDGESAVKTALEQQPEVVLLDIGLPDTTGYEVATRIRQKLPKILLIALSGWGRDKDRRLSQEAGFDHHLIKPVNFQDVQKLLGATPQSRLNRN